MKIAVATLRVGLWFLVFCGSLQAYTGGPTRAHLAGLDTTNDRVFYWQTLHGDQSGRSLWYFDLNGENPERPRYAPPGLSLKDYGDSTEIKAFLEKLVPLRSLKEFNLRLRLGVDSIGMHHMWTIPVYNGYLEVVTDSGLSAKHEITLFCEPVIILEGLYAIPGHQEQIVMITCLGDAYGCEEVDQPILLRYRSNFSGDTAALLDEPYSPKPFMFGKSSKSAHAGGQFSGRLYEAMESGATPVIYLELDYIVYPLCPDFWIINLSDSNTRPILIEPCGKDSAQYGREILNAIKNSNRRRGALIARETCDMLLHFSADSVGVDSTCGATIYQAHLEVETPIGKGEANFATLCNTTIGVRGVYPLPLGCELVIVRYTAQELGCDRSLQLSVVWDHNAADRYTFRRAGWGKKEFPVVIYPSKSLRR